MAGTLEQLVMFGCETTGSGGVFAGGTGWSLTLIAVNSGFRFANHGSGQKKPDDSEHGQSDQSDHEDGHKICLMTIVES